MRINPDAIAHLKGATFNAEVVAFVFEQMRNQAEVAGAGNASLSLSFIQPGDKVEPGDAIPVLTFSLQPAAV